jgi:hypothetical protein
LQERGAEVDQINARVIDRLLAMARDAATPPRQHFPGGLLVRRVRGVIAATDDKKSHAETQRRGGGEKE